MLYSTMDTPDDATEPVKLTPAQLSDMIESLADYNVFSPLYDFGVRYRKVRKTCKKEARVEETMSKGANVEEERSDETRNVVLLFETKDLSTDIFSVERCSFPSETGADLREFLPFPRLPPELRIKIWELSYPELVIPLQVGPCHNLQWNQICVPPSLPQTILVHKETYEEVDKTFGWCFEDTPHPLRKVRVNFKKYIFWFNNKAGKIDIPGVSADPSADEQAEPGRTFITTQSGENYDKIQRLLISQSCAQRILREPGTDPTRLYGLPAHLKELLVNSALQGKRMICSYSPGVSFEECKDKGYVEGEEDEPNYKGHGIAWWRARKEEVTEAFEEAKKKTPHWKAPKLIFGKDVPIEVPYVPIPAPTIISSPPNVTTDGGDWSIDDW